MLPYWLLFSIFAAGSLNFQRKQAGGANSAPILAVAGLFVALMIGLRFEVGGDWANYEDILIVTGYTSFGAVLRESDPGYGVLNWTAARLGWQIWFVNLICGAIFSWGLIKFARQQPNPWLAVLIAVPYLIVVVAMGYTRQGVAIGFIMAGLAGLERSSLLRFATYVVLAATFHKSAVVVLPLVALAATQRRIIIVPALLGTALLLYYLFLDAAVDKLMTNYVDAEYQSEGALVRVAMNVPPAIVFLLFYKRFELREQSRKIWRNLALASLLALLMLGLTTATTAVDRIALYLIPLQIFVLSRMPLAFGSRGQANGLLIAFVIAYSAAIQLVWLNYATHASEWLPYQLFPLDHSAPLVPVGR
ncbi:MAG TPA: EpsG family protein [Allosphingosinicella sp.]|nr:EpsG family protein [Allosphingosinicella sp.]